MISGIRKLAELPGSRGSRKLSRRCVAAVVAVVFVLSGGLFGPVAVRAEGTTIEWVGPPGGGNGYWHVADNWSPRQVPGNEDKAVIPAGSVVECVYNVAGVTLECEGTLTVSGGATFGLAGQSEIKGTGGTLGGNGTIEISGQGSTLTWSAGSYAIGTDDDSGRMVVGEGAELLITRSGQAALKLLVENSGRLLVAKNVKGVNMQKGYTQTGTGTLSFEISEGEKGEAVFGTMSVKQDTALALAGKLHVNLVDGYMPAGGTVFEVLVYPDSVTRSGIFDAITCSQISRSFTAAYTSRHVTLTAQEVTTARPEPSLYPGAYGGGRISVALSSRTEGATIYYTTDGSDPTTDSSRYTGPIEVTVDTTIRAFAVKEGLPDSPILELVYVIKHDFAGGDGTEENPYEVATAEQLYNVRDYSYCYFKQTADIDLGVALYNTDKGWLPIGGYVGEEDYPFCGTFDGQGYTISNLFIRRIAQNDEGWEDVGLFGSVDGAVIRNVKLVDADVRGDSYVGSLVGYAYESLIENCSSTGQVQGTAYWIGGLVGCSDCSESYEDSRITGSYSICIVSGETDVGGLVGENAGQIISSYAQGRVTATGMGEREGCAGGLIGSNCRGAVQNAYAVGPVEGNSQVGGLVGYNSGSINCAYAVGRVTGTSECGGLVGEQEGGSTTNSYWDNETSGQASSAGGTGKTTADMKEVYTYADWDFGFTWVIDASQNDGYPFLIGVTPVADPVEPEFAGGDGTEGNPYLIATAAQLNNVRNHLDKHFKQIANINLNVVPYNQDEGWNPIGTSDEAFTGTYDGNDKTITGLRIVRSSSSRVGLFGTAKGATLKNLTMADVLVLGNNSAGGLAGIVAPQNSTPTQIDNVRVTDGSVSGESRVGGLVGTFSGSNIQKSSAGCNVTGVVQCVGGLVGQVDAPATISECNATGNVTVSGTGLGGSVGGLAGVLPSSSSISASYALGNVTGKEEVGGLVGLNAGQISGSFARGAVTGTGSVGGLVGKNSGGKISRCFASGDAKGTVDGVGGLVGRNVVLTVKGEIENCYAMGAVEGRSQVGGLVGRNSGSVTGTYSTGSVRGIGGGLIGEGVGGCTNSYWDIDTSGRSSSVGGSGVVGKTTAEMKQQDTYAGWDFTETWGIHGGKNDGYPFLKGVTAVGPVVPSSEADILAFNFSPSDGTVIDCTATTGTVEVLVDSGTDLTDLKATFTLSTQATAAVGGVSQASGVTSQDFTTPLTYVVTAEDGTTTKNWTVKVTKREPKPDTEEPLWYYRSPWPTAKSLREVKYLNGKFMAVGERGALGVSVNGIDWTSSDLKVSHTLEAIAYGNGKYIAIGNQRTGLDGTIYGSADGVNWTHLATVPDHYLSDIICVDGKFVAVGQSGRILTSADGVTWKVTAAAEVKEQLNAVAYADGTYVAVGSRGVIVTSPDGENWTERASLGDTLRDVAYGDGRFVAVGGYNTACIYSSTDRGENWTKYAFGITCYGLLNSVGYDGSRFVTVGYRPDILAPSMFTSTDGTTWQRQSGIPQDMSLAAVAGGGGKWVAVSFKYDILTSTNGTTWAELGQGTRQHLLKVAYGGSTFVAVGYNGTIQTSSDGVTWTLRTSGTSEVLQSVRYLNNGFVAVGEKGTILTSADGTTWTKQTSGVSVALYDVTYGNGKYVAVGGVDYNAVILVSSDGVTWTSVNHDYLIPFMTVAFGNGTFISLGKNGQVYSSTDGEAWARTYLPGNGYPKDVIYADGRFVATGGNGRIWVSDDSGASWTLYAEAGGVSQYINSVDYGGGRLVAVASYGLIVVSADKGATWTQQPSGLADPDMHLYGVAAGDASFVAVGAWGLVLQSKDFGLPDDPDASAVAAAKAALTWDVIGGENTRQDSVTSNLVNPLPTSGAGGTTIGWSAEPTGLINTTTGAIARPTFAQGNRTVALTATIRKGDASDTVTFDLTVMAAPPTPDESIALDLTWLTWNLIKGSNSTESQVTSGLNLVGSGPHDTAISWSAEPAGLINVTTGAVTRPAAKESSKAVTLTATVDKQGGQSRTKEFHLTIPALPSSDPGGGAVLTYTITVTAGPGGTIAPKTTTIIAGSSSTFAILPDIGYEIVDVLVDGKSIGAKESCTFEWVNRAHSISATFRKVFPFEDVEVTDWFYESIRYVFDKDLMTGTGTETFSPLLKTSRAMIVTILHRLAETPDAPVGPFADVSSGTWYTDAVAWAAANGIVQGYGDNRFGPEDIVTREQIACFLYRYARYAGYDVSQSGSLSVFADGEIVSEWAVEAMEWAVGSGLIRGKGEGILDPTGPATRAEIAAMLQRFLEKYVK